MTGTDPAHPEIIEKLTRAQDIAAFHCGKPSLDDWLRRFALTNQQSDSARTYVLHRENKVLGYYSLAAGSVRREESPARIAKGLAKHPVSVVLLARLAVDLSQHGKGMGQRLLADAMARSVAAAEIIAARAVLVHALDEQAASFYRKFGFEPSPFDSTRLMILMKDIRAALHSAGLG